jgi:hypothetical protein
LSYDLGSGLSLGTSIYGDIDVLKGIYWCFGPSYTTTIVEKLDWTSSLLLAITKYQDQDLSFVEAGFKTGVSYKATETLSVYTNVLYNYNKSASQHLYAVTAGAALAL